MIEIKFDTELGMFILYLDGKQMMKNSKESTLAKKLASWLKSQGR